MYWYNGGEECILSIVQMYRPAIISTVTFLDFERFIFFCILRIWEHYSRPINLVFRQIFEQFYRLQVISYLILQI